MSSNYQQQLDLINGKLEETPEGPEKDDLFSLKQNIEELIALTSDSIEANEEEEEIDDEYALFMAELSKEGAFASQEANNSEVAQKIKDLEGKKFKAPHKHSWGQMTYHNAMICSVPEGADSFEELEVKVLFLNPTHKEMLPCPFYFDLSKDCHFSEEECRYSHGKMVSFSSLEEYQEPKFETLRKGSEVLAKKNDNLWYRAKIENILDEGCLVKFNEKNEHGENSEEVVFQHILPLEKDEEESSSSSESDVEKIGVENQEQNENTRQELINKSLLITPEAVPLGDWEKYTKGIGSKLMQKMGYIVGTGLGKDGGGIVKPVTALILPQGKSLDFCMNLKEQSNNPELFHHDAKKSHKKRKYMNKSGRPMRRKINLDSLNLEQYVQFFFSKGTKKKPPVNKEKDSQMLRDKISKATSKDMNVTNYIIEKSFKNTTSSIQDLKQTIQRLEEQHLDPKPVYSKLRQKEIDLKRLNFFAKIVNGEMGRRKNNKEMSEF